jgi:hypothetical protein
MTTRQVRAFRKWLRYGSKSLGKKSRESLASIDNGSYLAPIELIEKLINDH